MPSSLASPSLHQFLFKMAADSLLYLVQSLLTEGGSAVQDKVVTVVEELLPTPLPFAQSLELCLQQATPSRPEAGPSSGGFQGPAPSAQSIDISCGASTSAGHVTLPPQHDPTSCDMKERFLLADNRDVAVVRTISDAAPPTLPLILQLRLRLAYLRAANSRCVHWAVVETHRLEPLNAAQLGYLLKEVGTAGVALLMNQWPSCLSPEDVVRVLTATPETISSTDSSVGVDFLLSVLLFAEHMSDVSLVKVLGVCAHKGAGPLVAAVRAIMCCRSISSNVLFTACAHLEDAHQLGKEAQRSAPSVTRASGLLPQCPSPELLLLALELGRQAVAALVEEEGRSCSVDTCLYPPYEHRLLRYATLCCTFGMDSVRKFLEVLVPPDRPCPLSPMALSHVALHIAEHLSQRNLLHKPFYLTLQPLAAVMNTAMNRYEELLKMFCLRVDALGYQSMLDLLSDMENVGKESEICRQWFASLLARLVNEKGTWPKLRQLLHSNFGSWLPKSNEGAGGNVPQRQRGGASRRGRGRYRGQHGGGPSATPG